MHDVKILGNVSPSRKRRYEKQAMQEAANLYPGKPVRANHYQGKDVPPIERNLGVVKQAQYDPQENSVRGTILLNPHNKLAEQVAWDAEHSPNSLGLSHLADGAGRYEGKIFSVNKILNVDSVDVVSKPSTTKNLFESEGIEPMTIDELRTNHPELFDEVKKIGKTEAEKISESLLTESQATIDTQSKLIESLQSQKTQLSADFVKADTELQALKESAGKAELRNNVVKLIEEKGIEPTDKTVDALISLEEEQRLNLIESMQPVKKQVKSLPQGQSGGTDNIDADFERCFS